MAASLTAKWRVGQTLAYTFLGSDYKVLILSVDLTKSEPWYHVVFYSIGAETDINEGVLVAVNAVVVPTTYPSYGYLSVAVTPAAATVVVGVSANVNNSTIALHPAKYDWSATLAGYQPQMGDVTVVALQTTYLTLALETGTTGGTSWPWPMSVVESWFKGLYNDILSWIHSSVGWVYDKVVPLFTTLTHWVTSEVDRVWGYLSAQVAKIGGWISEGFAAVPGWIATEVNKVFGWIYSAIVSINTAVSGMFVQVWSWLKSASDVIISQVSGMFPQIFGWIESAISRIGSGVLTVFNKVVSGFDALTTFVGSKVSEVNAWFSNEFIDPFLDWLVQLPGKLWDAFYSTITSLGKSLWSWLKGTMPGVWDWLKTNIPKALDWLTNFNISIYTKPLVWEADIASYFLGVVSKHLEPAFDNLMTVFEKLGPTAPDSGRPLLSGIFVMGGVLVAGLSAMTLAGEILQPLKQMGFPHIAAMLYDMMNYKVLTAAFVGVLATVYISKPLTYYYNRIARPNLPNDRSLASMLEDRAITSEQYRQTMAWHGYPDIWIERIEKALYRPMTPYMLRSLAEAGLLDEDLLEHALNHAGYDDQAKVAIKQMMHNLSAGALATVSTGTAMSRYQEGFDDEVSLRQNLSILGVADSMLDRYAFAANLKQYYDYQTDLRSYYIDSYHRRDLEEPELRTLLATIGIDAKRIQLIVAAQRIKRLAAPKPAADPSISVQLDTVRARRKKQLITREQEIAQLVAIGEELPYATALADADDVALTPAKAVIAPAVVLAYETDEGKTKVDTIRRLTRSGQITSKEEIAALLELQMPQGLASAIADNDLVRIKKASA